MAKNDLTAERVRELLNYDPETGVFQRRVNSRRRPDSLVDIGFKTKNGYRAMGVEKHSYTAHRLAWLYQYGSWPNGPIDHINGDRLDNRICNLRDATNALNAQNRRLPSSNKKNGLPLGVCCKANRKLAKPFFASITISNTKTHLGYFETPEAAHLAYVIAKREIHKGCTI